MSIIVPSPTRAGPAGPHAAAPSAPASSARRLLAVVAFLAAAGTMATPAAALIGGTTDTDAFRDPRSPYFGMNWSGVYPIHSGWTENLRTGSAVAIGYFRLLTADHVFVAPGDTLRARGDVYEVVRTVPLPPDPGEPPRPDLKILVVRNRTNRHRPLPAYYDIYTGPLDRDHSRMVLVGWGDGGLTGSETPALAHGGPGPNPVGRTRRWGTNRWAGNVQARFPSAPLPPLYSTSAFAMDYWPGATPYECFLGEGDSGGGAFVRDDDGEWKLAGINLYSPYQWGRWWVLSAAVPDYADRLDLLLRDDLLPGDSDLDGDVDPLDYLNVKVSLGRERRGWDHGDFDNDGDVDRRDFDAVVTNFGYRSRPHRISVMPTPPDDPAGEATLPEPTALLLLAAAASVLLRRRPTRPAA